MEEFKEFFNDGFTQTDGNTQVINEGFKEVNPFLTEQQAEKKRKDTSAKILLENVRRQKEQNAINLRRRIK